MNNKQLAAHLGLSPNTTKKFSPEKRQQLITEAQQGINPQIAQLIGELATACYKASCRKGFNIQYAPYFSECEDGSAGRFSIYYLPADSAECVYVVKDQPITALHLHGAIARVEAL
jgi:hypothetical protein